MGQGQSRLNVGKFLKIILIAVGILIILAAVFAFFKIKVDAKAALRDAKNVQMALRSADIELYGKGKTIYDPTKKNGVADGVKELAGAIYTTEGSYTITAYNTASRDMTGMTFRQGKYVVYYTKHDDQVHWDVDYILNVYSLSETDNE
ncbi:MAG: hypothetical protein IJ749_03560 [Eubacterium sp.]|nr:hypothetical protein [Eubacterium sp.]